MNLFGIHFCHEEAFAMLAMVPFLGAAVYKVKAWWHDRFGCRHADSTITIYDVYEEEGAAVHG